MIMQRTHPNDLVGHLLAKEPGKWAVLSLPVIKEDGTALWEFKHTIEELEQMRVEDPLIFETQYQQNPKPKEGLLYKDFRTYSALPSSHAKARLHVDVADTGDDALCAIAYKMINNLAYVLDVIHTKERAETTEINVAEMAIRQDAEQCRVESNNGGRYFGRNAEQKCRDAKQYKTRFEYYNQRQNKESRILNNASKVNNFFIMPEGWEKLFPSFYNEVAYYMAIGKNKHDDGPDCLTAIYEHELLSDYGYKKVNR